MAKRPLVDIGSSLDDARRGRTGAAGAQGERGPQGPAGDPGRDGGPALAAHVAAADPHPDYALEAAVTDEINAAVAAHEAEADPHGQYLTQAEADALYDPIGAVSALIAAAVTNGDTTHAPSGDAVYDFVTAQVAALVAASPSTLDTLNELAAALGNDPNFSTTIVTSIADKAPLTRAINTTAPLTGGGSLAADRTIGISAATTSAAGSMSAADKAKLDALGVAGTFTPVVIGTTSAGVGTYTTQSGWYHRNGDLVYFKLLLTWTAHTGTGNLRLSGLPFPSANDGIDNPVTIGRADNLTRSATAELLASVLANTTQVMFYNLPDGGGTSAGFALDTAATLSVSGCYRAA